MPKNKQNINNALRNFFEIPTSSIFRMRLVCKVKKKKKITAGVNIERSARVTKIYRRRLFQVFHYFVVQTQTWVVFFQLYFPRLKTKKKKNPISFMCTPSKPFIDCYS